MTSMYACLLRTCFVSIAILNFIFSADTLNWQNVAAQGNAELNEMKEKWGIDSGSFVIQSKMTDGPELTCYYARPVAKDKTESTRKGDVVYFFHTPGVGDGSVINNRICDLLVKRSGMTVFALSFRKNSNSGGFYGDHKAQSKYYTFATSGSFKAILQAWSQVRRRFSIEQNKFFLYGYSAGGIGTQRFAEEYPEYTAGVVSVNGHTFIQKNNATNPFLILHTHGDALSSGLNLAKYYTRLGTPCFNYFLSPRWKQLEQGNDFAFHAIDSDVCSLAINYLEGLADLRRANNNEMPAVKEWPFLMAANDPKVIVKGGYVGSEIIVEGRSERLVGVPSAKFYSALLKMPPPPMFFGTDDDPVYFSRSRLDKISARTVILVKPSFKTRLTPYDHLSDQMFMDAQYMAVNEINVLSSRTIGAAALILNKLERKTPIENAGIMIQDISDYDLARLSESPPVLRTIVLQYSEKINLSGIFSSVNSLVKRGKRVLVLLRFDNKQEYEKDLEPVAAELRGKVFPPFESLGGDANLSLHFQQMQAAKNFLIGN